MKKEKKVTEVKEVAQVSIVNRNLPKDLFVEGDEDVKETEKKLKAELKSIADKVDTVKKLKRAAAHQAWKLKQQAKKEALKLQQQQEIEKTVIADMEPKELVSESEKIIIAEATVGLNSNLKVIRMGNIFYVVKEFTNVFGTMTDVMKECNTKLGALKDFSERLVLSANP